MSNKLPQLEALPGESRRVLAAVLTAGRNECDCEVCELLRPVADNFIEGLKPKKGRKRGRRKASR